MRIPLPRWLSKRLPLTLDQTMRFSRLLAVIKNDIVLVYPASTPTTKAPPLLSPVFQEFIAEAVDIELPTVSSAWRRLKDDIWKLSPPVLNEEEEEYFRKYGWKRGLTSLTLYPPTHYCDNPGCDRTNPLKKATTRQVMVYTLSKGAMPAYEVQLYCDTCQTTYFPDFSVHGRVRSYYDGIPDFLQIGAHQFVERRLVGLWTSMMLLAWVSATNCAKSYDMALSQQEVHDMSCGGWQFGCKLTTNHVYDAFIVLTLLDYHQRNKTNLVVPHNGEQKDRFVVAMEARNAEVIRMGQDVVGHCCDRCLRVWTAKDGTTRDIQPIVTDGISMGHVRCQQAHCTEPLVSNRDRFCKIHDNLKFVCSVKDCDLRVRPGTKSCDDPEHMQAERTRYERGRAAFTLRDRLQRHRQNHPAEIEDEDDAEAAEDAIADDVVEDIEWYEADADGNVRIRRQDNPGSIGTVNEEHCESSKSATGNRKYKALFGRCRTHNEQLLIWPCGVIFARATFYNAEAVSNVLRFVQTAFSVPGAFKPEHLVYDTNCDAKQQVNANKEHWSWFSDVGMSVDVFHFLHKHDVGHAFCNEHCNPILFPEMLGDDGRSWYFNTSIAEQTNVWFGGYHSMCREMLPVKYNFFLDEMIRLRNLSTLAKLADDGHNPRVRV
ncbi:hypothetical protein MKEN_00157500 [Mycena kentingensis (nom. inval.)]|nr:hypothetical protein MKEN_00157500 [Mycena kentingensis (nom. inval.)]